MYLFSPGRITSFLYFLTHRKVHDKCLINLGSCGILTREALLCDSRLEWWIPRVNLQLDVGGGTKEIYLDFNALNLFLCWIKKTKQNIATLLFLPLFSRSGHQGNVLDCHGVIYMQVPTDGIRATTDTSIRFRLSWVYPSMQSLTIIKGDRG